MTMFKIKTEVFEGPLDLLLSLVEKRKLMINDISLALVTDEYIQYVERLPDQELASRAEFIVVASTLLLIKSRSLLPSIPLTDEEQVSVEDLELRLKIFKIIRDNAELIKTQFAQNIIFGSTGAGVKKPIFAPHKSITVESINLSVAGIVSRFPKKEGLKKALVKQVISLEEMMERLSKKIQTGLSMSFRQFAGQGSRTKEEKVEVIVGFLAMLELVKQGMLDVMQEKIFEDIKMETTAPLGVPRY